MSVSLYFGLDNEIFVKTIPSQCLPFPACSAELVSTGHVHGVLEHRDAAHADATLQKGREETQRF